MHTSLDIPKLGPKVFIIGNVANEVRLFSEMKSERK